MNKVETMERLTSMWYGLEFKKRLEVFRTEKLIWFLTGLALGLCLAIVVGLLSLGGLR